MRRSVGWTLVSILHRGEDQLILNRSSYDPVQQSTSPPLSRMISDSQRPTNFFAALHKCFVGKNLAGYRWSFSE